jgi:hypothetical protein
MQRMRGRSVSEQFDVRAVFVFEIVGGDAGGLIPGVEKLLNY